MNIILKGTTNVLFGLILVSFHPVVLKRRIFKDFQFFNQSEPMAAISDVEQGHQKYFWKMIIQREIFFFAEKNGIKKLFSAYN